MKPKKVFIALPTYAQLYAQFALSLIHALRKVSPHQVLIKELIGESLIPRGRNTLVTEFLNTDCTHLLFLDTDLVFQDDTLGRMMAHDLDIVCGVYPKKQLKLSYVMNKIYEQNEHMWSVRESGTGAMLIKREVFLKMSSMSDEEGVAGWFIDQPSIGTDNPVMKYDYFRTGNFNLGKDEDKTLYWDKGELPEGFEYLEGTEKLTYLSEDWYFCQRWKQMGGDIWVDTTCTFDHVGQYQFAPPYKDLKEAVEHYEQAAEKSGVDLNA